MTSLEPPGQSAELTPVPVNQSLALGSLTFSDRSPSERAGAVVIQLETAAPGDRGEPGNVLSDFYQVSVALGASHHLSFPTPLVLSGVPDRPWVLRVEVVATWLAGSFETDVLAVGSIF